jgi:hypothetical protein
MEMLALPYFKIPVAHGAMSRSPYECLAGVSNCKERGVQKHSRCARAIAQPIRDYALVVRAVRLALKNHRTVKLTVWYGVFKLYFFNTHKNLRIDSSRVGAFTVKTVP